MIAASDAVPVLNACFLARRRWLPERLVYHRCLDGSLAVFDGGVQRYSRLLWLLRGRPVLRTPARIEPGDSLEHIVYDGDRVVAWVTSMPMLLRHLGFHGNVFDLTPAAVLLGRPGVHVEGSQPENYAVILLDASKKTIHEVNRVLEKHEVNEP